MQAAQSLLEIASFLAMTFYLESHTIKARKALYVISYTIQDMTDAEKLIRVYGNN
jgi:hypothetical protein